VLAFLLDSKKMFQSQTKTSINKKMKMTHQNNNKRLRPWTRLEYINVWVLFSGYQLLYVSTRRVKDVSEFRIYVLSSAKPGKTRPTINNNDGGV
jgi:hypothetical protein